jgi:acetyltransferase AlgX (SGNH hydrolase-like protein)
MKRLARAALWLAPATVWWGLLAVIARVPSRRAAAVTDVLFAVALPLTWVAVAGALVQASTHPRRAVKRAGAVTLGVLLALAAAELTAAARLVHWELLLRSLRGERQQYVPDADLGFRHTPSVRGSARPRSDVEVKWRLPASRVDRITMTYDRRGYRNPTELTRADIVLIGDSYVEGAYVSDDETVSSLLGRALDRPVANLGVAGYGPAQELIVLRRDVMPLEPRIVLWFFFEGNDLYNDQDFENMLAVPRHARAGGFTDGHGWRLRSLVRAVYGQLRLMSSPLVPGHCPHSGTMRDGPHRGRTILFAPEAAWPWTPFERDRWERAKDTLREGARFTRAHGVDLLVVYVPMKFRVYRDFIRAAPDGELAGWTLWPLPGLFEAFCRAEGLVCVDLTGLLRDAVRAGGMPHAPADSHWSPEGHRLIARYLGDILASRGWLQS